MGPRADSSGLPGRAHRRRGTPTEGRGVLSRSDAVRGCRCAAGHCGDGPADPGGHRPRVRAGHQAAVPGASRHEGQGSHQRRAGPAGRRAPFIGNIGAHPTDEVVTALDAREALDFLVAIVETIYVLRRKFQAMKLDARRTRRPHRPLRRLPPTSRRGSGRSFDPRPGRVDYSASQSNGFLGPVAARAARRCSHAIRERVEVQDGGRLVPGGRALVLLAHGPVAACGDRQASIGNSRAVRGRSR